MDSVDLIHGTVVSYQPELRLDAGEYGAFITTTPGMLYPGLSANFGVDVEEAYEEIAYTPAHDAGHILEKVRNAKLGEDLAFNLVTYPQIESAWPLLRFITGGVGVLGDNPDSTSWMKELAGKFSVFTGVMFEECKVEIPGVGVAKETYSGFAGHRAAVADTSPAFAEATEETSRPLVWKDISSIKMDDSATPTESIEHCVSDISFGFTSDIAKRVHPMSDLSTKMCGVRVVGRKMFVSLKLTWIDQSFVDIVTGSTKQNLKFVIGKAGHQSTFQFDGLYWPKYISKAEPKELVGDTITCITDQPGFVYSTGGA
jgi:hypothetical protein